MSSSTIYLCDTLVMPNGQRLWADDIRLDVDGYYSIRHEHMFTPAREWDWDFDVECVGPIIANDEATGDEIRLDLDPDHPVIKDLVRRRQDDIIQRVIDDCLDGEAA